MEGWAGKNRKQQPVQKAADATSTVPWRKKSPPVSKGRGKGKKGADSSSSSSSKRFRGEERDTFQRLKNLSVNTAKLSLQTARIARLLFAQAVITMFVPTCSLVLAMEEVVSEDPSHPEYDHVQRWAELILACLDEPKVPDELKDLLRTHKSTSPAKLDLLPFVKLCTAQPFARNPDMHVVSLEVTSEFHHLANAVIRALVSLGGTLQFGPKPRTNLEHLTQEALDAV
eukprot:TRINITY_DN25640_c0_g1_i1.p1 TRINITY_DN25640_c0_g1~~TRINITY_DN25640_c0_g1_i1.p1  ORF type:complete len:228 (+),score=26.16 TRINITY_DN25640_c0_g1_i1:20-703(+)